MGILTCSRCKATTIADSIEEGRPKLDHSIGLYRGKPCEDGKVELFLTGNINKKKESITTSKKDDTNSSFKKMIDKTKHVLSPKE